MIKDIIFHIVSRRKWRSLNSGGYYKPEELDEKIGIECVVAEKLNHMLNKKYRGRKNLFLLVIDPMRLANRYQLDKENGLVYVESGINLDAILDKIKIDCSAEGTFDIEVMSQ